MASHPSSEKAAAIARCANAYSEFSTAPTDGAAQSAESIAVACADLYSQEPCAEAFRAWRVTPIESRVSSIVRACRDAYCPRLEQPRPELCSMAALPPPSEMLSAWPDLNRRILAGELGEPPEDLIAWLARFPAGPATSIEVPKKAAPAFANPKTLIMLRPATGGRFEAALENGPKALVPKSPVAADFAGIAKAARSRTTETAPAALVTADKTVPYAYVVALLDALKRVGFTRVSLAVESSAK